MVYGSSLLIDMTPTGRPTLVGKLDFDLLPQGSGKACATRGSQTVYWVGMADIANISPDALTRQAIAAAITDAVARLEDVDSILLTSVVTEAKDRDRVCATVTGRGIRFVKDGASDREGDEEE